MITDPCSEEDNWVGRFHLGKPGSLPSLASGLVTVPLAWYRQSGTDIRNTYLTFEFGVGVARTKLPRMDG